MSVLGAKNEMRFALQCLWAILLMLQAGVLLAASSGEYFREERAVIVDGAHETWQLVWDGAPKPACGIEEADMADTYNCTH